MTMINNDIINMFFTIPITHHIKLYIQQQQQEYKINILQIILNTLMPDLKFKLRLKQAFADMMSKKGPMSFGLLDLFSI